MLLAFSLSVQAQSGPTLPCEDCAQNYTKPIPYEGSWYNPEQSGSGFLIDVQNDRLLGYYFGYDTDGNSEWALFSGQLQDASDQGALWKVIATLEKFNGGSCLNCEYTAPNQNGTLGEIEIVFNRLAHASFSVNGGDVQNIVPIYFGYSLRNFSEQQPVYYTPELQGWWTVFIDQNIEDGITPEQYTYTNFMVHISKGAIAGDGSLRYASRVFPFVPEAIIIGTLECTKEHVNAMMQTTCEYDYDLPNPFIINMGNISSNRIYGENADGDTIEMIRTSSDYCISTNQPENCINTGIFDYLNDGSD